MINVSLSGDKALLAKLDRLAKKDAKAVVRKASRKAAQPIMREARNNAPVKSGALRRSIKVKAITRSRKRIGVKVTSGTATSAFQGKTFYGAFLEFGRKTGKRGSENRREVEGIRFMKRAAETKAGEARKIFADEAAKEITALAKR